MGIVALSLAAKSVVQEPIKHATNAVSAGTGAVVAPSGLDIAVGLVGLCVAIGIGVKTYLEIRNELAALQLKKMQISEKGRRESDKE